MRPSILLVAGLLTAAACDKPRAEAPAAPAPAASAAPGPARALVPARPVPADPAVRVRRSAAAGGLTVEFLDDGRVALRGADRWGKPLDTTYESVEYLRNALPVLARSVTAEQSTALAAELSKQP